VAFHLFQAILVALAQLLGHLLYHRLTLPANCMGALSCGTEDQDEHVPDNGLAVYFWLPSVNVKP
jgi:hypothetical protein